VTQLALHGTDDELLAERHPRLSAAASDVTCACHYVTA